jgi:hypothetical protein
MVLNANPAVIQSTRRVVLLNDPYTNPANNLLWTTGQDNRGFQYQIALDALPPNVNIQQIRQGQSWFIENATTAFRLSLFISDPKNSSETIPPQISPVYGSYYDTTNQIAVAPNVPYVVTFNNIALQNGVTLVSGSQVTVQAAGVYNFTFSAQFALISVGGTATYNSSIWARKNGVDLPWTGGEISLYSKSPYSLPSWNFVQQMDSGDYFQLVWGVDTPSQVYVSAQPAPANGYAPSNPSPPYGSSVPSWILTVTRA